MTIDPFPVLSGLALAAGAVLFLGLAAGQFLSLSGTSAESEESVLRDVDGFVAERTYTITTHEVSEVTHGSDRGHRRRTTNPGI